MTRSSAPGQGYKLICTLDQEQCSWSRVQNNLLPPYKVQIFSKWHWQLIHEYFGYLYPIPNYFICMHVICFYLYDLVSYQFYVGVLSLSVSASGLFMNWFWSVYEKLGSGKDGDQYFIKIFFMWLNLNQFYPFIFQEDIRTSCCYQ